VIDEAVLVTVGAVHETDADFAVTVPATKCVGAAGLVDATRGELFTPSPNKVIAVTT
jgi:hypothetical protein